jgi:hypothetical protein
MFRNVFIDKAITLDEIKSIASEGYEIMVKAVVDIDKAVIVIGAELHVDEESYLLDLGSNQEYLWGINIFPDKTRSEWIQFNSMINVRPSQNNRTRSIEDIKIQQKISEIVDKLIKE